jgi:hypothetical protein
MTLAALALSLVLTVAPVSGPAPLSVELALTHEPGFELVCLDIDSMQDEHLYQVCAPADPSGTTALDTLTGTQPGQYKFRALGVTKDGETTEGNTVIVTITE